jgi:hypothetical protein
VFSIQFFYSFQTSFRIYICTLLHSVHANAYIIYLVLRAYIHVYTTCLHAWRSQLRLEPVYSITRRSHGGISDNGILPLGLWLCQAKIPPIPLELLLCIRSVGANSVLLPTIKKEINMNINHHNKYYEWHSTQLMEVKIYCEYIVHVLQEISVAAHWPPSKRTRKCSMHIN